MKDILTRLFNHEELTSAETKQILLNITREAYPEAQISALLTVFQMRSITVDELIGFREALMETRIPIDFAPYRPIDIVGTGGDGKNTFNISTCACFVVAGAGYNVAKHGNYGATSVSGASNVMEQHGIRFTNDPDKLKRSMDECNIAYLHAQLFNRMDPIAFEGADDVGSTFQSWTTGTEVDGQQVFRAVLKKLIYTIHDVILNLIRS